MSNQVAKKGQVFVCGACGKRSKDRYGEQAIDRGWDVSCMLHAVLCVENGIEFDKDSRVTYAVSVEDVEKLESERKTSQKASTEL